MSNFKIENKFFKENLVTFSQVFFIVIGLIISSFYLFNTFLEKQIEVKKNYLANQAEVCGHNIEQNEIKFTSEFKYFISNIDYEQFNSKELKLNTRIRVKNFLEFNSSIIDTLYFTNENYSVKAWLTDQHFLSYNSEKIAGNTLEQFSILNKVFYDKSKQQFLYATENFICALSVNREAFFTYEFDQFYIGDLAIKNYFTTSEGLVNIQIPEYLSSDLSIVDKGSLMLIKQSLNDGLREEFMFDIQSKTVQDKLLTAMYPIYVLEEDYAILFCLPLDEVEAEFYQSFQKILIISIAIILIIVILFSFNIFKIRAATEELKDNKHKLTALVRQQKLLLEYSDDFTYRFNVDRDFDYVSENVQRVLGFTPEQFANPSYRKYTSNPINKIADDITEKLITKGIDHKPFYVELYDSFGEAKVLELREKAIKNEDGSIEGVIGIAKDITEKFNSDLKFRVLFEYSSDPHLIYDSNGVIDCNEATLQILGLKNKSQIIQKKPAEFSPEFQANTRDSILFAEEMDAKVIEQGNNRFEWLYLNTDGVEIPVEVSLTKVNISQKQVILSVWHDLTERKKVEEALISAKQKAEELANQKQQFLSAMSHEIRTPLNAVIGYTHLLLDENPSTKQIDKLKSLQFSADNLLSLVNDILDHSKIESGKIEFAKTTFKLRERLVGIREMFDIKAKKKHLDLILEIDQKIPERVIGDPVRLNQILINLVGNSIKFTNRGQISIIVRLKELHSDYVEIDFSVKDTGIGISEEKQKMIFDTFVQANSKILNEYGGTGLGLSISKNLVEFQGGKIGVKSTVGKGSEFSFSLKFGTLDKVESKKITKNNVSEKPLENAKILLVEDNLINQKIACQFLNRWGAEVVIAVDGQKGYETIQKEKFDLVLMDLQMPLMDGYESTRAIRSLEDDYYKTVPIITLTADAFVEVKERTFEAGMNDYVTKPINPVEFLRILKKYYN